MSNSMLSNFFSTIKNSFSIDCFCYELFFGPIFSKCNRLGSDVMLSELGYDFNLNLQLRKLKIFNYPTTEPFDYYISSDPEECRIHYEKVCAAINNYIYKFLILFRRMEPVVIPVNMNKEHCTFFFVSQNCLAKNVLLVLIQGSGAVRAGQWSRSVSINEGLLEGSQIPYVEKAAEKDYGLIILNPNDNFGDCGKRIPYSGTPIEHARYVWDFYIQNSKASNILIMADGYGGTVALALANYYRMAFKKYVKAIALTNSIHEFSEFEVTKHFKKVSKNWVSSTAPLDAEIKTFNCDITRVSAGHPQAKKSPNVCIDSVFKFFEKKLSKGGGKKD